MARTTKTLAAAALAAAMIGGGLPAGAQPHERAHQARTDREAPTRDERPQRMEELRLRCGSARGGVACAWSASRHPDFAGYRLWRGVRGEDGWQRSVVLRTTERRHTRHFDPEPAKAAIYVVQAINARGQVIARSEPQRVHSGRSDQPRRSRALPAPAPALRQPA